MDKSSKSIPSQRYLALDIHKHYSMIGAVNRDSQFLLDPRRVEHSHLEAWLRRYRSHHQCLAYL